MEFILAQIFGGVALILVCISYFLKKKVNFLILQIFADVFYAGAFFVVGANVAGIVTAISIVRNITLFFKEKYDLKYIDYTVFIFIALYVVFTILFWNGILDIIPLISSILFALCFMIKDLQKMRYFLIIPNAIVLVYNILCTTYTSAVLDFIEIIVIIVALINFNKNNQNVTV